jgi:hypothetical protein
MADVVLSWPYSEKSSGSWPRFVSTMGMYFKAAL